MKKTVYLFLAIVLSLSFVSASFELNSSQIETTYNFGDIILGKLNISFTSEDIGSKFSDGFSNEIGFYEFLEKHSGLDYSCLPASCQNAYTQTGDSMTEKTFTLSGERTFGAFLNGVDVEVTDLKFDVSSDASDSCINQLKITLADNEATDIENQNALGSVCGTSLTSTCYEEDTYSDWFELQQENPYCEKISLTQAPTYEIRTTIKKEADATPAFTNDLIKGTIYDSDGDLVGECNFPEPSTSWTELSCNVEKLFSAGDHSVCVLVKAGIDSQGYKIQSRITQPWCGFSGSPSADPTPSTDYNIKAAPKKYAAMGNLQIDSAMFYAMNGETLSYYINNFLEDTYNSDCTTGCIIPIKFSGVNQEITLENLKVEYSTGGSITEKSEFYETTETPAKINSDFIELDLSLAEFEIPSEEGNHTWELELNNQDVSEQEITILGPAEYTISKLYPKVTAAGNPTMFSAFVNKLNSTGINFIWEFSDGSSKRTTTINQVQHTYSEIGNYSLNITLKRGTQELSTSSFKVEVKTPKDAINSTLIEYEERIDDVETQINALSSGYKTMIDIIFNVAETKEAITVLDTEYKRILADESSTEDEYITVMIGLAALDIPTSIKPSTTSNIKFLNDLDEIDLDEIDTLFGEKCLSEEIECQNAILEWFINNIEIEINHKSYSMYTESSATPIFSEYSILINPKSSLDYGGYFVIGESESNIVFDEVYDLSQQNYDSTGITLDLSTTQTVTFATEASFDVFDLSFYLAPELGQLSIKSEKTDSGSSKWWIVWLSIGILIVLGFIGYIFLQEWYNKNYEKTLFKNRTELYNLIYFIKNARTKGLKNDEIKKRLKKSKWRSEQVSYALKKLDNKRVGMWEIPLFSRRDKKKLQEEMMKRRSAVIR